jgi:ethanolamine ammonia-lyase large subunit
MRRGAPVGLVFQSLAGSQAGNEAFGIDVGMMDEAYALAQKYCFTAGPNYMYFETGQGSELSADAHHGADQLVMEARCYGFAKRYHPYQVNTVVGFIGPEYLYDTVQITRAGLEDHFMGKLTGISMGCRRLLHQPRPRSTQNEHREPGRPAQRRRAATTSWAIPMGDDVDAELPDAPAFTTRPACASSCGLRPLPEFEAWMEGLGLLRDGRLTEKAGDASFFLSR